MPLAIIIGGLTIYFFLNNIRSLIIDYCNNINSDNITPPPSPTFDASTITPVNSKYEIYFKSDDNQDLLNF